MQKRKCLIVSMLLCILLVLLPACGVSIRPKETADKIIFQKGHQLYWMDVDGGHMQPILLGERVISSPAASKDGRTLAVICNPNIDNPDALKICLLTIDKIVDLSKLPIDSTFSGSPAYMLTEFLDIPQGCETLHGEGDKLINALNWSNDGKTILLTCKKSLCFSHLDGSSACLPEDTIKSPYYAAYSPTDDKTILVGAEDGIYLMDEAGTGIQFLAEGYSPAWSNDGKTIAYIIHRPEAGIALMDQQGKWLKWLYQSAQVDQPNLDTIGHQVALQPLTDYKGAPVYQRTLVWSTDDNNLVFSAGVDPTYAYNYPDILFRLDVKTQTITLLQPVPDVFAEFDYLSAVIVNMRR